MVTAMWIGYSLIALFFLYIFVAIEVDGRLMEAEYKTFYAQFETKKTDENSTVYPLTVHRRRSPRGGRRLPRRYSLTVK